MDFEAKQILSPTLPSASYALGQDAWLLCDIIILKNVDNNITYPIELL